MVKNFDAIIVRCNPGQIKADGGSARGEGNSGLEAPLGCWAHGGCLCQSRWVARAHAGDQGKFDDGMRALRKQDIQARLQRQRQRAPNKKGSSSSAPNSQVWPAPDVMEFMGAKARPRAPRGTAPVGKQPAQGFGLGVAML